MTKVNRFGLSRNIPAGVKRLLRQEAGFGCVVCGLAIATYEHIVDFRNVKVHDPNEMAYLCHQCHGKVTRGHLSKGSIRNAKNNPKSKSKGFSWEAFDLGKAQPDFILGPLVIRGCPVPIQIEGIPVFSVKPADDNGQPMLLSADIRNNIGKAIFRIIDNEWQVNLSNWDVEVAGSTITIRNAIGDISLRIEVIPGEGKITVHKMDMTTLGHRIICDENEFFIQTKSNIQTRIMGGLITATQAGIDMLDDAISYGVGSPSSMEIGELFTTSYNAPRRSTPSFDTPRNAPCPCESRRRFKECCGRLW